MRDQQEKQDSARRRQSRRSRLAAAALAAAVVSTACDDGEDALPPCADQVYGEASDPYIDCVERFDPAAEAEYGHDRFPEVVYGPPEGVSGALTLGCGGSIELYFAGEGIVDVAGVDFIVFENPFDVGFPEAGVVAVSEDGERWREFPCDSLSLEGCAGVTPTEANAGSGLDPTDPSIAGGDGFDLADVDLERASYVRIVDVSADYWQSLEQDYCDPGQGGAGGFDLDAVAIVGTGGD